MILVSRKIILCFGDLGKQLRLPILIYVNKYVNIFST